MADVNSFYVKIWCSMMHDPWFVSLNLGERGMWVQLIVLAKMMGDTGKITAKNWSFFAQYMGCDVRTCRKIAAKMSLANKVRIFYTVNLLEIEIVKYHHHQHLRKSKVNYDLQKCGKFAPILDEMKGEYNNKSVVNEDKNNPVKEGDVLRVTQEIKMTEFVRVLMLGNSRDWVVRLLRSWTADHIVSAVRSMNDFYQKKGIPVPVDANLKPKIREWIERHDPKRSGESDYDKEIERIERESKRVQ